MSPTTILGNKLQGLTWPRFCWCYSATSCIKSLPDASSNGPWDSDSFFTSSLNSLPPAFSSTDPGKEKTRVVNLSKGEPRRKDKRSWLVRGLLRGSPEVPTLISLVRPQILLSTSFLSVQLWVALKSHKMKYWCSERWGLKSAHTRPQVCLSDDLSQPSLRQTSWDWHPLSILLERCPAQGVCLR